MRRQDNGATASYFVLANASYCRVISSGHIIWKQIKLPTTTKSSCV